MPRLNRGSPLPLSVLLTLCTEFIFQILGEDGVGWGWGAVLRQVIGVEIANMEGTNQLSRTRESFALSHKRKTSHLFCLVAFSLQLANVYSLAKVLHFVYNDCRRSITQVSYISNVSFLCLKSFANFIEAICFSHLKLFLTLTPICQPCYKETPPSPWYKVENYS